MKKSISLDRVVARWTEPGEVHFDPCWILTWIGEGFRPIIIEERLHPMYGRLDVDRVLHAISRAINTDSIPAGYGAEGERVRLYTYGGQTYPIEVLNKWARKLPPGWR